MNLQLIKDKMKEAKLTQDELAHHLEISRQSVSNKLNGSTQFNWEELIKIKKLLKIKSL